MEVHCIPLVQNVDAPLAAPATTRTIIPKGYGTQEQCLPFTAATALGFLIGSPITFGFCPEDQIPDGAHSFLSPVISEAVEVPGIDLLKFYVKDDYECNFVKNAFYQLSETHEAIQALPGLSFFDREDCVFRRSRPPIPSECGHPSERSDARSPRLLSRGRLPVSSPAVCASILPST